MWIEAGFDPDAFWHQTPATFRVAMAAIRRRRTREAEEAMTLAWEMAAFGGAAQAGKLRPLRHYLGKLRGNAAQAPEAMLAMLKSIGGGTDMTITRIKRGG